MRPIAALLCSSLFFLHGCATGSLEGRDWFEVDTRHFRILSSLSEKRTENLARNAELFHSAAEFVMGTSLPSPAVPTRIVAFDGRGFRRPFAIRGASSHLRSTLRETFLVFRVGGGWREDVTPAVRHEYMHYLLESHGGFGEHLWFDEGFSQLMSTVDVRRDHVDLGQFRADYLERLRTEPWIPMLRILRAQDLEDWGQRTRPLFYAQSWAFVHYLFLGQKEHDRGRAQLQRYFKEIEIGSSYEQAIERAFGRSSQSLDKVLHEYVRSERFDAIGVRFPSHEDRLVELRKLPSHAAFTQLGWLALAIDREQEARRWFERAAKLEPDDARAQAGLGRAADLRSEWGEALVHHERAVELEPNDALNRLDLGIHYYSHAKATPDAAERAHLISEARLALKRSSELDESLPEPYAVYGETFLLEGQEPGPGLRSLEHAHRLVPYDPSLELSLARMYFALERPVLARKMTLEVHAKTHSKSTRVEAEQLLQEIDAAAEAS